MVNSLPFLVVLDMCTTLARLDLGILRGVLFGGVLWCLDEFDFSRFDRAEIGQYKVL